MMQFNIVVEMFQKGSQRCCTSCYEHNQEEWSCDDDWQEEIESTELELARLELQKRKDTVSQLKKRRSRKLRLD